jgi:hypothetical protein
MSAILSFNFTIILFKLSEELHFTNRSMSILSVTADGLSPKLRHISPVTSTDFLSVHREVLKKYFQSTVVTSVARLQTLHHQYGFKLTSNLLPVFLWQLQVFSRQAQDHTFKNFL